MVVSVPGERKTVQSPQFSSSSIASWIASCTRQRARPHQPSGPFEKCNDRSNKSNAPVPHPENDYIHRRGEFAMTAATRTAVCGYRYVTLVGTCKRHYPLPRRAILKIENHLSCNAAHQSILYASFTLRTRPF